jgi:transcriptional regulator with XRE-family HTH domain
MDTAYKKLREKANLTQGELANALGMATQYWQQIEAGKRNPRTDTTKKIAQILAKKLKRKPSSVLAELTQIDEEQRQPVGAA